MSALHRADALSPTRPETEQHAPSARSPLQQPAGVPSGERLPVDAFSSAVSLLKALKLGQVSAAELLALYRRRIRTYDPTLQVFVHLTVGAQTARTRGTLAGLPLTLEEGPSRSAQTSTPGRLARKAGATIVGHTRSVPLDSAGAGGRAPAPTRNPWDTAHTAGANTSAAAVAAGLTPLALALDGAGQARLAASLCGVYAHRPSQPIARQPVQSRGGGPLLYGVIARAAEDLELGARLLGTADGSGAAGWWLQAPPRHTELAAFRVAVLPIPEEAAIHAEVADAFAAFVADLRHHGAAVRVLPISLGKALSRQGGPPPSRGQPGELERQRAVHLLADLFKNWDVLLMAATAGPAPRHDDRSPAWSVQDPLLASIRASSSHPATVFPIALTRQLLPISLQVIGPYLEDRTPIHFAALAQQAFGGYHRAPGYSSVC